MVATRAPAAAAFCRAFAVAGLCLLAACEAGHETTLARSARQRQVGAERAERLRLERERELLRLSNAETRLSNAETAAALAAAKTDGVKAAAELRAHLVALRGELDRLQRGEQDLAAARARANEIEAQIAPLRALEATVRDQEQLRAATAQRLATLTAEVEAANKRVAEQEAELLPRLQAMQERLLALQQLRQVLDEAAKALTPPPAPAPAAPAAAEPKK